LPRTEDTLQSWKMNDRISDRMESERIQALNDLGVLDTPPEERFDRLTRLARKLYEVPIALVSLVDIGRQWLRSRYGVEPTAPSPEWSFCSRAVEEGGLLIAPDTTEDERFRDHPLVTGESPYRFYAGQPIRAPGGVPVGALCIIDTERRDFTEADAGPLIDLAGLVEQEMAIVRMATTDELTGLSNRRGFQMLAQHSLAVSRRTGRPATLLLFDLDDFKKINDRLGHTAGDAALASFAAALSASYRDSDVVARIGGDEFCVLLSGAGSDQIPATLEKFQVRIGRLNESRPTEAHLRFSVGFDSYDPGDHDSVAALIQAADDLMYRDKRQAD